MSIRKDVTVKITNNNATLDMPLQIYELDHGIELRFKLMDYKYKYTKDPQNILNSSDEDILEAYTTIINPKGYELQQINGEVKDDIVIFMIDSSYTDEIDEIGMYSLQIHIKCACSEFSIPPIQFEVLQRLKGIKVVTDGEDSIDDSALIDNYSNFISDETGKLLIEWKKGDIISSVKLNAMVEVINNAVDEEAQRQLNEVEREQQELERENRLQAALNSVDARVDESMNEYETRFNALTAIQQQDAEVIDARDGETSLKARLDRDIEKAKEIYVPVEGTYVSTDSSSGYAKDIEMLGNTIQDASNLADIRSVGDKVEGQELYEIYVVSRGKNLFDKNKFQNLATDYEYGNESYCCKSIQLKPNTTYTVSATTSSNVGLMLINNIYSVNGNDYFDLRLESPTPETYTTSSDGKLYIGLFGVENTLANLILNRIQIEEGTVATPYEPYQEDKLTILSPTPLEKVGDVADRIICKDGVWGVEKKVLSCIVEDFSNIHADDEFSNVYRIFIDTNNDFVCMNRGMISSIVPYNGSIYWLKDEEGVYSDDFQTRGNRLWIHISKSKITTTPEDYVRKHLPIKVIYKNLNPTFIPLPHDQQIKLRTFAGQTNIHFETEIEGTIKAQVPKSIGATVNTHTEQIGNLSKELDRVKKLEESTVSTVETESDFTTVEATSGGYFEDVKLEGKTLVNLLNKNSTNELSNSNNGGIMYGVCTQIKPNTEYTIAYYVKASNTFTIPNNASARQGMVRIDCVLDDLSFASNIYGLTGDLSTSYRYELAKFTTPSNSNIKRLQLQLRNNYTDATFGISSNTLTVKDVIILEGDHTQNPPSYFEGLMSVGQDVEEVSIESVNENLFDSSLYKGILTTGTGEEGVGTRYAISDYFICPYDSIYFSGDYVNQRVILHYDKNKNYLGFTLVNSDSYYNQPINSYYARIRLDINGTEIFDIDANFKINVSKNNIEYQPHQSNKKPLLYYNNDTQTWEKPILRQWDSIEKHSDGKYYYHKRSGEVVLNGSEGWIPQTSLEGFFRCATTYFIPTALKRESNAICDRFKTDTSLNADSKPYECVLNTTDKAYHFVISSSKLSTQDVQGFKQWLQANPTTVVYQLAEEKVYECANIDLITYANETNYVVNSGVITPKSTLKVMCNINNVVRELQQKVSNLENYIQHVMTDALNNALNE